MWVNETPFNSLSRLPSFVLLSGCLAVYMDGFLTSASVSPGCRSFVKWGLGTDCICALEHDLAVFSQHHAHRKNPWATCFHDDLHPPTVHRGSLSLHHWPFFLWSSVMLSPAAGGCGFDLCPALLPPSSPSLVGLSIFSFVSLLESVGFRGF